MSPRRWTVWRRPRDSGEPWREFLGLEGSKRDCLVAMQEADRAHYQDADVYEYIALEGDARPAQDTWQTSLPTWL